MRNVEQLFIETVLQTRPLFWMLPTCVVVSLIWTSLKSHFHLIFMNINSLLLQCVYLSGSILSSIHKFHKHTLSQCHHYNTKYTQNKPELPKRILLHCLVQNWNSCRKTGIFLKKRVGQARSPPWQLKLGESFSLLKGLFKRSPFFFHKKMCCIKSILLTRKRTCVFVHFYMAASLWTSFRNSLFCFFP